MSLQDLINCSIISVGALIVLYSIVRAGVVNDVLPFVREGHQKRVRIYLLVHRALMTFFLLGYGAAIAAIILEFSLLSDTFISVIFLFGGVFVYISVLLEAHLLNEIEQTIQGIVPICTRCKKIQAEGADADDPSSWSGIESYISARTNLGFSHGYCPECFAIEMSNLGAAEK